MFPASPGPPTRSPFAARRARPDARAPRPSPFRRSGPGRRAAPRRRRTLLAVATAAAVGVAPASASAACTIRWQPGLFGGPGSTVPVCESGPSAGASAPKPSAKKPQAKPKVPTKAQYRTLRYRPTAAVSARVEDALVRRFAAAGDEADVRARVVGSRLVPQFHSSVKALGGSSRDIADAYATALVVLWYTVNGRDRWNAKVSRAVRKEVRRQFALDRQIRRTSDAIQQERAEWLGSWTVLLTAQWQSYRRDGDAAAAREWQQRTRTEARHRDLLGLDLSRIRLTSKGIVTR